MTEYALIIAVILSVAVAVAAYRIIHGIFRLVLIALAAASIVLGVAAFFVVMDANELKENLGSGKSLVVFVDGTSAVFAMELRGQNGSKALNKQEVDEYSRMIGAGDYGSAKNGYYKLIVISTKAAEGNETESGRSYGDEPEEFFVSLAGKAFSEPLFFVREYKKGNIRVYDETAVFRAVKLLPVSLVESTAGKAITRVKVAMVDKIGG